MKIRAKPLFIKNTLSHMMYINKRKESKPNGIQDNADLP